MSEIIRLKDIEDISSAAARRWTEIAKTAVRERGSFTVALSGGNTPRHLYETLASPPLRDQLPWEQTFVFWGDERRVPPSSADSDYRMAKETLLDHIPIPTDHIFRMVGEGLASGSVRDYEDKLRRHFKLQPGDWPTFDLMLLGMGSDGHIASIFPGTRAVSDLSNMVIVQEVPQLRAERITLTRPVFNHARNVLFLVSGAGKAAALAACLEGPYRPSTYPAQGIKSEVGGSITWLIDKAAAAQLKRK